jgi:hypothetical protein
MEEMIKALSNVNINSASAEVIVKWRCIQSLIDSVLFSVVVLVIMWILFVIMKNFGTGKWE